LDKCITDQAEGLRRLLAGHTARVVAVTSGTPGAGCSSTVLNLAAALTALGKDVLVVDEHGASPASVATHADGGVRDGAPVRHALGFSICAAGDALHAGCSTGRLAELADGTADIVLVDARRDAQGGLSALAREAHDVVIVARVAAAAITDAYACMKRLHYAHAFAQFRILLNHVHSRADARTAYDNLAGVAGRYLSVSLAPAGCVEADPLMERSRELRRVAVEAFPSAPAARDYRQIAADLLYWPLRPQRSRTYTPAPSSGRAQEAAHAV
jgi:flagellar biosynthesis protein FlhG